jgi:hypothetical protein
VKMGDVKKDRCIEIIEKNSKEHQGEGLKEL